MQGRCFQTLRAAFTQALQVPLRRGQLGSTQLRFFRNQVSCFMYIARHEHGECSLEAFENSLVKGCKFSRTFTRKLELALDFLPGHFAQILVNDVTDMLKIDHERDDL